MRKTLNFLEQNIKENSSILWDLYLFFKQCTEHSFSKIKNKQDYIKTKNVCSSKTLLRESGDKAEERTLVTFIYFDILFGRLYSSFPTILHIFLAIASLFIGI